MVLRGGANSNVEYRLSRHIGKVINRISQTIKDKNCTYLKLIQEVGKDAKNIF